MIKQFFTLLLLLSLAQDIKADSPPLSMSTLNDYVNFTNESIHGMLIVHRLLELYNQDINKYVDLEGYDLNNYSNSDLPKDIFEDPERWFFDESPYLIYDRILKATSTNRSPNVKLLNQYCTELKSICTQINNIRFDVEKYISTHDLTQVDQLQGVYDRLEKGVSLYQQFYTIQLKLEKKLNETFLSERRKISQSEIPSLGKSMFISNNSIKKVLRALRAKKDKGFKELVATAKTNINKTKDALSSSSLNGNAEYKRRKEKAQKKLILSLSSIESFYNTAEVPTEYKLYGKFYFYHNSDIINKVNRYGNGYVKEFNEIIKLFDSPFLYLFEEPHFYQVIYPKKLEKDDHIKSSDDEIEIIPTKLKDREIVTNSRKIKVDSDKFEMVLYDHLIADGDIVSINFNGDWILENYSLEAEEKELKIQLNPSGKNYLLLHAESIGKRPPNTMTISYMYNGKKESIALKSDLNESELIEIELVQ